MILWARPMAAPAGLLKLWVGAFAVTSPPHPLPIPRFSIGDQTITPQGIPKWFEVRDKATGPGGQALNYFGVFLLDLQQVLAPEQLCKPQSINVVLLGKETNIFCKPLPADLPDNGLTLLLSSCFYFESDEGGLARLEPHLTEKPDLIILAGDQVYLDNPYFETVPSIEPDISQFFAAKYARNFLCTDTAADRGLQPLLRLAPTACIPDDHELWNNYPSSSPMMWDSFIPSRREKLVRAARALYEDYQLGEPGKPGAQRIDIGPLHLLLTDMRFDRVCTHAHDGLYSKGTAIDLARWRDDLLRAHRRGELAIGVLASGQVLFADRAGALGELIDDNLQCYAQFSTVQSYLRELATAGVPVLFLSGDVHFSRVTAATFRATQHECLFEVICSPCSLVDPFPHPTPQTAPLSFDANRFGTRNVQMAEGNLVSTLNFHRSGIGVRVQVDYYSLASGRVRKLPNHSCSFDMVPRF